MIQLAAFDLDGTLVDTDLVVSPRLRNAVKIAKHSGTIITIATGRDASLTARFARELGLTCPLICAQGGLIYDYLGDRVLHDIRLPNDILSQVIVASEQYGWNLHFEMADRSFLPAHSNHPAIIYELLRYSHWSRLENLLEDLPDSPHKFLVTLNHPGEKDRVMKELCDIFAGKLRIVPSHPYLIEGVPLEVSKASGLAWLAAYLHIKQEMTMAVGDNDNDVPMIEWAGIGVALANASPAAKAAADWIAPRVDEDGAAIVIEKFLIGKG